MDQVTSHSPTGDLSIRAPSLPRIKILQQARLHASKDKLKIAIVDRANSQSFTYTQLLNDVAHLASEYRCRLAEIPSSEEEHRIAFLVQPGYDFVVTFLAVWAAGAICVPLCTSHPVRELAYTINNSQPSLIVLGEHFASLRIVLQNEIPSIPIQTLSIDHVNNSGLTIPDTDDSLSMSRRALIIYTSGTTSRPKGCVLTHHNIDCQAQSLIDSWKISSSDHLIHVLPLHHVHGLINGLITMLVAGATVEILPKFNARAIWNSWSNRSSTCFTAVPTVYSKLVEFFDQNIRSTNHEDEARSGARSLRLIISGSAALPVSLRKKVHEITGHVLLERYGMTEIGMALSATLDPDGRPIGSVGWPLPKVRVRLVHPETNEIVDGAGRDGLLEVKGGNVFSEYWRLPQATASSFSVDGWFKTGDIARRDRTGAFFIQGRASVDIIKSGGYKISAIEVEEKLLALPTILEAVVVGVEDGEWGQRVAAIVSQSASDPVLDLATVRNALRDELAPYKIPTLLRTVPVIERNAMGKINKKAVRDRCFGARPRL